MKPRIKLVARGKVFIARLWVCQGFDESMRNWHNGTGWTPQEAFFNWKMSTTIQF